MNYSYFIDEKMNCKDNFKRNKKMEASTTCDLGKEICKYESAGNKSTIVS